METSTNLKRRDSGDSNKEVEKKQCKESQPQSKLEKKHSHNMKNSAQHNSCHLNLHTQNIPHRNI